jgi:hypothetical protein
METRHVPLCYHQHKPNALPRTLSQTQRLTNPRSKIPQDIRPTSHSNKHILVRVRHNLHSLGQRLRAARLQLHNHGTQTRQRNRQDTRPPPKLKRQFLLLKQAPHILYLGFSRQRVRPHSLQIERILAITKHRLSQPIHEFRIPLLTILRPGVLCLGGRRHIRLVLASEKGNVLLPVWVVKGLWVTQCGVLTRHTGVVLNGEVMLAQVIEVEGAAERIGRGEQAGAADGSGEVGAYVEAYSEAGDEVRDGHVAAIAVDEAVVCEAV